MYQIFYPAYADKIFHKGKGGNIYQLDTIKKLIAIYKKLKLENNFKINKINISDDSLMKYAHSKMLLNAYKTGKPLRLAESSGIQWNSDYYWKWLVNKSWAATKACTSAINNKVSLALHDGGHHAEFKSGFGFCPINSMVITAKHLIKTKKLKRVAILDLDIHYANGTHSLVYDNQQILSTDIWKFKLDKWHFTKNGKNIYHLKIENLEQYWKALQKALSKINEFKPDIVLYYMGLDVLGGDSKGGIENFNSTELLKRENIVKKHLESMAVPYCIFIGGGYVNYKQDKNKSKRDFDYLIDLFVKSIKIHLN